MTGEVIVYTTSWCGYCLRLKRGLEKLGIAYREVDIEEHPEVAIRIEEATGGFRTVPTVELAGELMVNPRPGDVEGRLQELSQA